MKSKNYSKIKQVMRHKAELEAIINETIRKHNEMNKAAGFEFVLRPVVKDGVVYLELTTSASIKPSSEPATATIEPASTT